MILPLDAEKPLGKIQHPFIIFLKKSIRKRGIEGNFLNLIKDIYKKPTANILMNGERLNAFLLRSRIMQSPLLFNIALAVLATVVRKKEVKGIQLGKENIKLSPSANDILVFVGNSKDSTKTPLEQ